MKTAHDLARELLAGPDLTIFHFDPSCAGYHSDDDTGVSAPVIERVDPEPGEEGVPFLTIVGNQHEEHGLDADT